MQGSHKHIPETNHVPRGYIIAAILHLLFMVPLSLGPALALCSFTLALSEVYYYYYYYYYHHYHHHHHHHKNNVLCRRTLFSGSFLNRRRYPTLMLQFSVLSTFRVMCYVRRIAVFPQGYIEYFSDITFKFLFRPFATIPVAPVFTGVIIHVVLHVRFISLYSLIFSASLSIT